MKTFSRNFNFLFDIPGYNTLKTKYLSRIVYNLVYNKINLSILILKQKKSCLGAWLGAVRKGRPQSGGREV